MKALGVEQAILVGHSAGALTAMELFKRCVMHPVPMSVMICCPGWLVISSSKVESNASLLESVVLFDQVLGTSKTENLVGQ